MQTVDKGDLVRVSATFKNSAGSAVDPGTVRFKFRTPAGAETTYTYPSSPQLIRDSTGVYHVDIDANLIGRWVFRWESTGVGQAAAEGQFLAKSEF